MEEGMKTILVTPPELCKNALLFGVPVAHLAYKIGGGGHLYRANIPLNLRGGLMVISDGGDYDKESPESFAQEVSRECINRGYRGVVADFQSSTSSYLSSVIMSMSDSLERQGIDLYIPEAYARSSSYAKIIISSALSGGTLRKRMEEVIDRLGAHRVSMEIERMRMDFTLPSYDGNGKSLTSEELKNLMAIHGSQSFFSDALCAYYFTYREKGEVHFVIYDDLGSIRKKIFLSRKLGIDSVFLLYPEIGDIMGVLSY